MRCRGCISNPITAQLPQATRWIKTKPPSKPLIKLEGPSGLLLGVSREERVAEFTGHRGRGQLCELKSEAPDPARQILPARDNHAIKTQHLVRLCARYCAKNLACFILPTALGDNIIISLLHHY